MVDKEQLADTLKDALDANKDGVIDEKDVPLILKNGKAILLVLGILAWFILDGLIAWWQTGDPTALIANASLVSGPFIITFVFKKVMDASDKEKTAQIDKIKELENKVHTMELDHRGEVQELKLTVKQMEGAQDAKNREIDWLRNKIPPQ